MSTRIVWNVFSYVAAKLKQNAHFSNNIVQFKRCLRTQFIDLRQEKPLS